MHLPRSCPLGYCTLGLTCSAWLAWQGDLLGQCLGEQAERASTLRIRSAPLAAVGIDVTLAPLLQKCPAPHPL